MRENEIRAIDANDLLVEFEKDRQKEGNYMGYRTYLSLKQYTSKEEREEARNKFFSEITDYCKG